MQKCRITDVAVGSLSLFSHWTGHVRLRLPRASHLGYSQLEVSHIPNPPQPASVGMAKDQKYIDALVLFSDGMSCSKKGDYGAAIERFDLAIKLFQERAERRDDKSAEVKSLSIAALSLRGDAYKAKGDFDSALADYNEAISQHAGHVQAYMGRAELYELIGQRKRAIADYEKALSVGPEMLPEYRHKCTDALKRLWTVH